MKQKEQNWVKEAISEVGAARKAFSEFLESMREQGYTDDEIYQLVLIWLEPLGPEDD